jgi:transcriptional regulator with XRE-family HTH domain
MSQEDRPPFQAWLQEQLDQREWTRAKLARELELFKVTIGRWLMPPGHPMYRRPSYESCRRLADLFGVDMRFVLELAGIDDFERERNLSQLQRDVMALVAIIPDDILATVYAELRPLIEPEVRQNIRDYRKRAK